jgi:hypothetical protein
MSIAESRAKDVFVSLCGAMYLNASGQNSTTALSEHANYLSGSGNAGSVRPAEKLPHYQIFPDTWS